MISGSYNFGELVDKWIDNRGKTPPLAEAGIPLLEVKHLPDTAIFPNVSGTKFVGQDTYDSWFRAYLEPDDILFSTVGTTARVVMTPHDKTLAIAQNVLGIRFKKDLVYPWFMFYYMRGSKFQHDVEARLVTTVQASIKRADMVGIPVDLPSMAVQKEIVDRIILLDQKIQLNHQINQTLEQMAQAIFKSWFVDFEPVKAKIAARERWYALQPGNETASSACYAGELADQPVNIDLDTYMNHAAMQAISGKDAEQLALMQVEKPEKYADLYATAELFPSAMQDSELGEIPEGWNVVLSGDVLDVRDGTHASPKKTKVGYPLVTSKHITSGVLKLEETYLISKKDFDSVNKRSKVDQGDILLTMIGTVGIPFYVIQQDVSFAIKNIGLFKTSATKDMQSFFYLLLKSDGMKIYLESRVAGTTQKYLSLNALRSIEFVQPSRKLLGMFSESVAPFFDAIEQNIQNNSTLSSLRDTLLPKLLSGELSVADIESEVEA